MARPHHHGLILSRAPLLAVALAAAALGVAGCGGGKHHRTTAGRSLSTSASTGPTSPSVSAPTGPGANSDWPVFGHDRSASFYSPLTQITAANVGQLGLAWSSSLGRYQALVESYPTVVGNNLYVTTSTDEVQAYDAATGRLRWQYAPQVDFSQSTGIGGYGVSTNRGVAVADGKVLELTFDDRLQALSESTGEMLWSATVASDTTGAYETMSPAVYDGLVFTGVSGSQNGIRGFIAAYDENTGKQVWRFYTVPPAGTDWVPKGGGGGGVYMPPTIDTQTGLVYVGTGTPAPVIYGVGRRGADLYTDAILALNARTGKLVWYFQEVPHDLWNYAAAAPVAIFDVTVHGAMVHAVAEPGKDGRVYFLDAKTGKELFPPLAYVKVNHPPPTSKGTFVCPGAIGGSPYSPLALDPQLHTTYVSGVNLCQVLKVTRTGGTGEKAFGGVRITPPGEKPTGTFDAVDLQSGKILWQLAMPTPMIGGATVAGSLVFTGDQHGYLYAIDARAGRIVWKAGLGLAFGSAPAVFMTGGREYIAVALGGSASTASNHLGPVGARIVVLTLGGGPIPAAWQRTSAAWASGVPGPS
jgi:alcohol dehydrogenase (cytochrome c)